MGPEIFDCSGFIVRSVCDVKGVDVSAWPTGMRHVRDMWKTSGRPLKNLATLTVGDILVEEYTYISQDKTRPGHIGIVVASGEEPLWLHASPKQEKVLISEVPTDAKLLGTVSVNL
jgi:hypothetical protein